MVRKIGILTQPLRNNYGGLIQNYALQTILTSNGYDVCTINREYRKVTLLKRLLSISKRVFLILLKRKKIVVRAIPTTKELHIISQNNLDFIRVNINNTDKIYNVKKYFSKHFREYDAIIVGSDQVWRLKYSPNIKDYFLDFIPDNAKCKRITYAASFGLDQWHYPKKLTKACSTLAKKFDAISVREESAISLCKNYLNVQAKLVLDPTMLLEKKDYVNLIKSNLQTEKAINYLYTYILDETRIKRNIIEISSESLNIPEYAVKPKNKFEEVGKKEINDCIYPSIDKWLSGFYNASFVITDSFHGTVFSIIFNKNFIAIGNSSRGISRLVSILKMFGLENRLVLDKDRFNSALLNEDINYDSVNEILRKEKEKSLQFLLDSLNN